MSKFKVGDICIGQNFIYETHLNGMEGTITQSSDHRPVWHQTFGKDVLVLLCYEVEWANGDICKVMEPNLKLKQNPPKLTGLNRIIEMFNNKDISLVKELESV